MARSDVVWRRSELRAITDHVDDYISLFDPEFRHLFVNRAIADTLGRPPEDFVGLGLTEAGMPADIAARLTEHLQSAADSGAPQRFEYEMAVAGGRRSMHTVVAPIKRDDGSVQALIAITRDVTDWKRAEALRSSQNEVMRALAGDTPLPALLDMIVQLAERNLPGRHCAIMLADAAGRLQPACAPQVPAPLLQAIAQRPIGPDNGSCGAAAFHRRRVIATDVDADPAWLAHRELARAHGIGACWSQPILAPDGELLGTLAIYHGRARDPSSAELAVLEELVAVAALAIRHRATLDSLLEFRERYKALAEHAANIISVTDLDGRVLETSPALQAILGYAPSEMVGQNAYAHVHPDDLAAVRDVFRKLREQVGTEAFATYRYRHKDGSWRVLETAAKSRLDHRGQYIAVVNARDITDSQRMTEALRLSEERLGRALEASDLGMWDWNIESGELYLDASFSRIMGYEPGEVPSRAEWLVQQLHPDDRAPALEAFTMHLKGASVFCEVEYRARHKDGSWKWIHARGQVTERRADGWALRMTGTNRDVTETRRLQDRLERALSASAIGLWDWDVDSGRLEMDQRGTLIHGWPLSEFQPHIMFLRGLMHSEDTLRNMPLVDAHRRGETPYYEVEYRARGADGQWRWVCSRGKVTLRDAQGQPLRITGTVRDIDAQKRTQERLDQAQSRIQLLLEATDEGIIGLDAHGCVSFVNPAATRMLGYPAPDMQGQLLYDLVQHVRDGGVEVPREATPVHRCLTERARCRSSDDLFWRSGAQLLPVEYSVSPILDDEGRASGAVLIVHDVSEKRSMAHQLHFQALHDPLTGLINRRGFEMRLNELLASAKTEGREHALCYMDLDQFKLVNDTCGHAAGDELLRQLPRVLQPMVRGRDIIARLGGDEFAILLQDCPLDRAAQIAANLRDAVRGFRFIWQYRTFTIGASIGVVGITADSQGLVSVLGAADTACYVAKDQGPNHVHVSYPHDLAIIRRRGEMRWIARLKTALEEDRFTLHFQSISSFDRPAAPAHHELLIRLLDNKGEVILPGAFIAAAERYQLMPSIDAWVIEHAIRYLGKAIAPQRELRHHRFGINLSGESLRDAGLLDTIRQALHKYQVPATMLYFEITETAAISNLGAAVEFMRNLRQIGCQLALDDFGSGMSSFSYLKHLPVDYIKIDGSFVKDILTNPVDHAIVQAINSVGQQMGIATIAEYVESAAVAARLHEIGVNYAQGYSIAVPMPLEDFASDARRRAVGGP